MRDKITINKNLIPYSFNIILAGEIYSFSVDYNGKHDFFTVRMTKDGTVLCEGEPLIYGKTLFSDFFDAKTFPALSIVPIDESGHQDNVTFENLGETVFLSIDNRGDSIA